MKESLLPATVSADTTISGDGFIAPNVLYKKYDNAKNWLMDIKQRAQTLKTKLPQKSNDYGQEARRLNALRLLDNIIEKLDQNTEFYSTQPGAMPYATAKGMETQLNAVGLGFFSGTWKLLRCGTGYFYHMCGFYNGN